jgi:alpha-1,6-mannosyltransferase
VGAAVALVVGVATATAWSDASPVAARAGGRVVGERAWAVVFLALLVLAFALYVVGLLLLRRRAAAATWVVAAGLAVQLAPLTGPLLLSADAWTYWGYARLDNPYEQSPVEARDSASLEWLGERWRDTTSVYGPAFSLAVEPTSAIDSPSVVAWVFRATAAAAVCVCVLIAARAGPFASAFVGWNPVLAVHAAGGGHNDAWIGALVVAALAAGALGRREVAGVAWAIGSFVKWIPLVLLPLRALEARTSRRRVGHLGFAGAAIVVVALATWQYGLSWVEAFGPLARNAGDTTSFALPSRLTQMGVPKPVSLALFAVVFAGVYAWLARQAWRGRARVALAACVLLLCAPYLTPWYLAWVVPLAAVEDDREARLLALALTAYLLPQTIPV